MSTVTRMRKDAPESEIFMELRILAPTSNTLECLFLVLAACGIPDDDFSVLVIAICKCLFISK